MTKSQTVAADVAALLRARHPLLWIVTKEEARVERYLTEAAQVAKYVFRTWDVAQGICNAEGAVEVWSFRFPLTPEAAARMDAGVRTIPRLLEQAKENLIGNRKDLWSFGVTAVRQQSADLAQLLKQVENAPGELAADVERAKRATDAFVAWIDTQLPSKTGPSGVGIENYDWYLKNVQLAPYSWQEEVAIMERELARATALLSLEEHKNAKLPPQLRYHAGHFGVLASVAAFTDGGPWLEALLRHLDANRRRLSSLLDDALPAVRYVMPEGGYLAWLDCRALGLGELRVLDADGSGGAPPAR